MSKTLVKSKLKANVTGASVHPKAARSQIKKNTGVGVVKYWVHGHSDKVATKKFTSSQLIETLKEGLPVQELDDLRRDLDLPMEKLVPMLGISKATLHRRKAMGRLDVAESDRVARYARLLGLAANVMESIEAGRHWLTSPQIALGGATPLVYAETEIGAREVENLLGRIEHGVYS